MSPRVTLATARRVLEQLRGDRRTIALLLLVPCVLMTLLRLVYDGRPAVFDRIGLQLLGIFPFVTMFLVTSWRCCASAPAARSSASSPRRWPSSICCSATRSPSAWPRWRRPPSRAR